MSASLERAIQRILVAIDDSGPSREALAAAADLAAKLGARLEGLFVEDENLLRGAALPFALEVSLPAGTLQRLDLQAVEAQLRAAADSARAALAAAAGPLQLEWSFRVARGQVGVELVGAASGVDLLVVGRRARLPGARPGRTARAAASSAPSSVLVASQGGVDRPLAVAYDGSPAADRTLEIVRSLGLGGPEPLTLLVSAGSEPEASRLAELARQRLGEVPATARWTGGDRLEDLVRTVRRSGVLLIVPAESPALREGGLERLLDALDEPLLLLR